jgi:hypothetical protein
MPAAAAHMPAQPRDGDDAFAETLRLLGVRPHKTIEKLNGKRWRGLSKIRR